MGIQTNSGTVTVFDPEGYPHVLSLSDGLTTAEDVMNRVGVSPVNHGLTTGGDAPLLGSDPLPADAHSKVFTISRALPAG